MFNDDRLRRRRKGSGTLLLLFLIVALGYPLWHWRKLSHPLMAETSVDLCRKLASLPGLAASRSEGFSAGGAAGGCRWHDRGERPGDEARLEAMLTTTRSSGGMDLVRRFNESRDGVRANYGPSTALRESGDEGQRVLAWRTPRGNERMIEDYGILLNLHSRMMDDAALDALVQPARSALRSDPGKAR